MFEICDTGLKVLIGLSYDNVGALYITKGKRT